MSGRKWRFIFQRNQEHDPVVLVNNVVYIAEDKGEGFCRVYDLAGNKLIDPEWVSFDESFHYDGWSIEYINKNSIPDHSPFNQKLDKLLGEE